MSKRGSFVENERLYVDSGQGYAKQDLFVALVRDDYIKVRGRANLLKGDRIKGFISGTIADVTAIDRREVSLKLSIPLRMILVGIMILVRLVKIIK